MAPAQGWHANSCETFHILKKDWVRINKLHHLAHAKSCPTLCNVMGCSLPGSSVHGVFQARILEWVAISLSRGSSWTRDWTCISSISRLILFFSPLSHLGTTLTSIVMGSLCSTSSWHSLRKMPQCFLLTSPHILNFDHIWTTAISDTNLRNWLWLSALINVRTYI